jgi:hypothetical protein
MVIFITRPIYLPGLEAQAPIRRLGGADLNVWEKRKISCPYRDSSSGSSIL